MTRVRSVGGGPGPFAGISIRPDALGRTCRRVAPTALLALAACLGPRSDPSAFFLLSSPPAEAAGAPLAVSIGVGPLTLPGYLDRPQIVVRLSEDEIRLAESDRWGEPLAGNLVRTVEENLAKLLPGSSYVDYPWYPADAPDYAVEIEVRRFEADAGGA
ncbi:MAG TPA: PqiC family protein, partial [Longimicrobiales bacterium]|nr:PqiC family protein [Longimicrobiales bacterium]